MEENQENKAQELKQETVNTFNQAKEQMKNINLKEEAEIGKGLLKKLWKNPVETIKEVVSDNENKCFCQQLQRKLPYAVGWRHQYIA